MLKRGLLALWTAAWVGAAASVSGAVGQVRIADVKVDGQVQGDDFRFDLAFTATADRIGAETAVVSGAVALAAMPKADGWRLRYDEAAQAYVLTVLDGAAPVAVAASFVAKTEPEAGNPYWRAVSVVLPAARVRQVKVIADRADLELELKDALQQSRQTEGGKVVVAGLLGPDTPLAVRWKAHVETVEAKLLVASEANTIRPIW